jgi:hypothetical protein
LRSKIDSIRFDSIAKEETGDRGDPDPNRSSIPPGGVGLGCGIKSRAKSKSKSKSEEEEEGCSRTLLDPCLLCFACLLFFSSHKQRERDGEKGKERKMNESSGLPAPRFLYIPSARSGPGDGRRRLGQSRRVPPTCLQTKEFATRNLGFVSDPVKQHGPAWVACSVGVNMGRPQSNQAKKAAGGSPAASLNFDR